MTNAIEKLRQKTDAAVDMGDAGKFVVLTKAEAVAVLAEIDSKARPAIPALAADDEHVDGQQMPGWINKPPGAY